MPKKAPVPLPALSTEAPLLTRREAARVVGLSATALRDLAHRREGPRFLKRGPARQARCLYTLADLHAWLAARARIVG
jgi:hypothetical protein